MTHLTTNTPATVQPMSHWEKPGMSNDWYTPKYIFDALECRFDLDVAGPANPTNVPADSVISKNSLETPWTGFVWMNPPFGSRNGLQPWLTKFIQHRDGIALVPDRTSAPWFVESCRCVENVLFVSPKVKFVRPDGSTGKQPGTGTALLAIGAKGRKALSVAHRNELGTLMMMILK